MTRGKPGGSQETRVELLDAGLRILIRDGLPSGFNVKLTDVVREASRTTGAAYQIWPSQDEFRLELATYVARHVSYADLDIVEAALAVALSTDADLQSVVEMTGRAYFEHLVSGPEFFLSLHFWATSENLPVEVTAAVQEGYASVQASFEAFFGAVLDHFNVGFQAPHTLADLTMAATAITEGSALRYRFAANDRARADITNVYVGVLASVLTNMTTATG